MSSLSVPVQTVPKKWGKEVIFVNNAQYCGKLLVFKKGNSFSMHFHKQKDETWYLLTGKLLLNWIDTIDASQHEDSFDSGQAIHIPPLMPHQLEALEDSVVLEVSTQHFDHDSYRIALGTAANPVDLEHDGIYTVAHMEKRMRELLK